MFPDIHQNIPDKFENYAWVSIHEPYHRIEDDHGIILKNEPEPHITSEFLDHFPKLSIRFWDITSSRKLEEGIVDPITDEQAKEIVDFLLEHKDKNIITNCYAGHCRSAAVCQFCEEMLGHEWLPFFRDKSEPNQYVYKKNERAVSENTSGARQSE